MICISNKNAMEAFYYLMAVDGEVDGEELAKFNEIGREISSAEFDNYKDTVIKECLEQIATAVTEDETYDVIQEGLDHVLINGACEVSNGIPIRWLVWNLLAIAFVNEVYSTLEQKLILHVVRTSKMDRSVFLEMEQLIKTAESVKRELAWIQTTNKTYAEVRPIVDELEKRQRILVESAQALIEDEIEPEAAYTANTDMMGNAKIILDEKIGPLAVEISEKTRKVTDDTRKKLEDKVSPAASEIKAGAGALWNKFKSTTKL